MKHQKIFFFIGIWLMIMPILGLPAWLKTLLVILSGLALVVLSYTLPGAKPFFKRISASSREAEDLAPPVGEPRVTVLEITNDETQG